MTNEAKLLQYLKKVTADLAETRRQLDAARATEPIAIVAMSCRYPGGVRTPEDLWRLVVSGTDAITGLPEGRGWDVASGDAMGLRGGFVADADRFDAALFGISPREALTMDPQQRLVLESSWEVFERAGIDPLSLRGNKTGVFLGAGAANYAVGADLPDSAEGHLLTGSAASVVSGRVAYTFGLKGPALTVDTACSSSLVAIHLACQSLRAGECGMALAGGVSVMAGLSLFAEFGAQGGLASDGRCKAFADAADGTGWGEGAGVLLLMPLSAAVHDGREVLAVIRGSAVNSDGASNGLTAPNGPSQRAVIEQALAAAGLTPSDVDAVEAHGTGTRLGDPIEAQALLATYGADRTQPLWLGSVKSNIGHTQAAAGVAGVIKLVLALRRGLLPPTLHADEPSTHIDWASGAVSLLTETQTWPRTGRPRRAGVSSFGMSGTNVHAIIEQAPAIDRPDESPSATVPVLLSGRTAEALRAQAEQLLIHLETRREFGVVDVARSLATGRAALAHRAVAFAGDRPSLQRGLREIAAGRGQVQGIANDGRVAFLFSGQGSQRAGMGRELAAAFPVFATALAEITERLDEIPWDDQDLLNQTQHAQAALFVFEVALFRLLESWGLTPDYLVGHSIGELAAAHVAGVLSLADACTLVSARGKLMQALPAGGAMLAVEATEAEVPAGIDIAAINSPTSLVVSGTEAELTALQETWQGRRTKRLKVSHAFHSKLMEPMLDGFAAVAETLTYHQPRIQLVTTGDVTDPGHWVRQVRDTVRFADAVAQLRSDGVTAFLELGPEGALSAHVGHAIPLLRRDREESLALLGGLGAAHVTGVRADWAAIFDTWGGRQVELPTYPFEGDRYWLADRAEGTSSTDPAENRFWQAVETADVDTLAATLGLDAGNGLSTVLPALSSWRKGRRTLSTVDSWRYRVQWQPLTALPAPSSLGTWLVVTGETHPAVDALRAHGATVIELRPTGTDRWDLAGTILDTVTEAGGVDGVLSLLGLQDEPHPEYAPMPTGLVTNVLLLQALGDARVDAPLWTCTQGAVAAGRADNAPNPMPAQIWGYGRVAALEFPARWGGLIDLPETLDGQAAEALVSVLAGGHGEDQVAVRHTGVFGRRLARAPLADAEADTWTPTGTVLITGGTGALGARVARWLAARGATDLVITSRSGPAAQGAGDLVAELAERGVTATVVACDVADRAALAGVLAEHPVTAVMHTAGVAESVPLAETGMLEFADVLRAKVGGALNLDALLPDVETFVLFSSIGGIWGSGNAAAYGAANTFLDALAEQRRARGRTATAVAWGPWAGAGMAAGETAEHIAKWGLAPMPPDLGLTALGQALDQDETNLVVSVVDWATFAPIFCTARHSPLIASLPEAAAVLDATQTDAAQGDIRTQLTARLIALSAADRTDVLLDIVRTEVAAVLGHRSADEVSPQLSFQDLGVDSLTAIEVRDRLATATGLRLPASLAFDYPKPVSLAAHLLRALELDTEATAAPVVTPHEHDDEIAIIAMACRLPGGITDPGQLWQLLADGGEALAPFPDDRGWNLDELFGRDRGSSYVRAGGFLRDAAEFDAAFFGISPREAVAMDPQQRLLLETAWEAFERAGIDPTSVSGSKTGVFVGSNAQDYGYVLLSSAEDTEGQLVGGTTASIVSGRLAYTFGLQGPTVTVDTACSSSLVALHLAGQALRAGECSLALAGGVTVMSTPGPFVEFSTLSGLSEDGRCKAFADAADGTGWGEGAGILLVERLADARRHGHEVLAVIRGSAINSDGASNGLTAPNGPAQQAVIRHALATAGLRPSDVDAVEAHGTGTTLGDPIEAQALINTYGQDRDRPLWLGAVKSNLGHTQAAAGVAGVMKMVLALRHELLPKTLHVDRPSTHVDWTAGEVALLTDAVPWPRGTEPRRAGVSSFGASGTNAHVIIEEPEPVETPHSSTVDGPVPLVLSASNAQALRTQAARLRAHLTQDVHLADAGFSLATTRATLEHRAVVVGERAELLDGLAAVATGKPSAAVVTGSGGAVKPVFVFPGQGSQWPGMAAELLDASPVFRAEFQACAHALAPYLDFSLVDALRGDQFDRVDVVQPLLFAVMVSLAALWRAHGVEPAAVVGHSQGELAAAVVCGALSLADAAAVVALRSQAIAEELSGKGGMVSIALGADLVRERITAWAGAVDLAAVNGPGSVVVSGTPEALDDLVRTLTAEGLRAKHIPVDYASHSGQVEALHDRLRHALAAITPRPSAIPFVSAVTGAPMDTTGLDAEYWYTNLRRTVRFDQATEALLAQGHRMFVEVSPHAVLTAAIQEAGADAIGTLRRDDAGLRRFYTSLAEAHVRGLGVDWTPAFPGGRRVELPTYAFQRKRFWPKPYDLTGLLPPVGSAQEDRFWSAVAAGDTTTLAGTLDVLPAQLEPVLPALASWRRKVAERSTVDSWRYTVGWRPVTEPAAPVLSGRWLLLTPPCAEAVARSCATALRERLAEVDIRVVDPTVSLSEPLNGDWTGILSLLALDTAPHPQHGVLPVGVTATLSLLHAVVAADLDAPLWCVTQGAVGDVPASPEQAQAWGLGRVAALEHPRHWGGLVDLPQEVDERAVARLAAVLARTDGEDQLAVRPAGVLARRLVRAADSGPVRDWKPRGTVLVTGGTGAIGGHVARWLAAKGAEHLVLVSRRGPLAPDADALSAELTALGAKVTIAACDVADRDDVVALLADLAEAGVEVNAVMHTAGLSTLERLEHTGIADLAGLVEAKIAGARHLDELLDPSRLDAVVYFSSIAGVWGVGRHGGYAVGNAYLDALAQRRRADGVPVLSVAWGPWDGGGMVAATEVEPMLRRGVPLIKPEPAMLALQQALDHDAAFVAAAEVDWAKFAPAFTVMRPSPLIADLPEVARVLAAAPVEAEPDGTGDFAASIAGLSDGERERAVVELVRTHAAVVLRHDSVAEVPVDKAFRDFGFDSLTAVELRNRLTAATGLELPVTVVFDRPTPVALARYLLVKLAPQTVDDDLPGLDELDRLEAALAARADDDIARVRVVLRLESLLAKQRKPAAGDDELIAQLGNASNDELFDLVDRDLGVK